MRSTFHHAKDETATGRRLFLALLLAVPALADETHKAQNFSGKVVRVSDGDTVTVLLAGAEPSVDQRDGGEKVKVRLAGIDCPEKGQPFGEQAREFTEKLCLGKKVKIAASGTDRYGRVLGEIILPDGRILNEELLRAGLAWWYRKYAPDNFSYEKLEREAREAGRGLWPAPPWEFRKRREREAPKKEARML